MEILRFGPGFRRAAPAVGTRGLADQTIWSDPRARITELALSRKALLPPRTSPDLGLLIVISGGGIVQIGDARSAIHHGEAVELPPNVSHGAWTEGSEMRAILVELPDRAIEASHQRVDDASGTVSQAEGRLADRTERPEDHDETEGEPW